MVCCYLKLVVTKLVTCGARCYMSVIKISGFINSKSRSMREKVGKYIYKLQKDAKHNELKYFA